MELHHYLCMSMHSIIIDYINRDSTKEDCVNLALLDYRVNAMVNIVFGIIPYDRFTLETIIGDVYHCRQDVPSLNAIDINEFYKVVLERLYPRCINPDVSNEVGDRARTLAP